MARKFQFISICLIVTSLLVHTSNGQIFDRLMGSNTVVRSQPSDSNKLQSSDPSSESTIRQLLRPLQTVSIPAIYEMTKEGNSLGVNVLSGLVKVERGLEAERNGLTGPRPLSVRVFGVPVYERGHRTRSPTVGGTEPLLPDVKDVKDENEKPDTGPDEELPADP